MNLFYLSLGILPSLIWLFFYLRKDVHPEPKRFVIRVFIFGIIFAFIALFFELNFKKFFLFENPSSLKVFIYFLFFVGFLEEIFKYLAMRLGVLKTKAVDEPVDLMIYMIISALGFVTVENVLVFLEEGYFKNIWELGFVYLGRFLVSTFLHTITSGILGYFLVLSLFNPKNRKKILIGGVIIVSFLHNFYNLSIISIEGSFAVYEENVNVLSYRLLFGSLAFLIILFWVSGKFLFRAFKKVKEKEVYLKDGFYFG
jgi:RsiW-degrading membrane proteinase PrsW (M82 family)